MKLIDLLVQELPKRGGWPEGVKEIEQDGCGQLIDMSQDTNYYSDFKLELCDGWEKAVVTREQYEKALAASQQPVWNGEGLPPVGCECEIKRIADWMPVTIKFISDRHTVFTTFGGTEDCYQTCSLQFRAIRSEEDRKRDEALNAMAAYCTPEDLCTAIFAGKIPHIQIK
ncbi:hypothetical protein [Atlantibacter subterraneus]|uniref:hypothetical protein n=1 Tax=Atlantibacter subterraneus TaxID=255519 RepID=UPI0022EB5135|nr:hypothetical protein [Atlantibacter subterranea]MDA3133869.1 hypothetical protein [Atlantibacter subterranea]